MIRRTVVAVVRHNQSGQGGYLGGAGSGCFLPRLRGLAVGPLRVVQPVLTHLQGPLGCASEHLHVTVHPGHHVPGHVGGAVSQALDVTGSQDAVPHVKLAQLPHERLGGIEAPPYGVLPGTKRTRLIIPLF